MDEVNKEWEELAVQFLKEHNSIRGDDRLMEHYDRILGLAAHCKELREALKYYVKEDHWDSVSGDDCYIPHVFVEAGKNTDPCEVGDEVLNKRPGDYDG